MHFILYVILLSLTLIYLVFASVTDLKERSIYVFPLIILQALWSVYLLFGYQYDSTFLAIFWLINLLVYMLFNHFGIWGAGDSDLFLLMGNVMLASGIQMNGYAAVLSECLCLGAGLGLAIGISRIEAGLKNERFKADRSVAVVPGVAVVMAVLLIKGMIWRVM